MRKYCKALVNLAVAGAILFCIIWGLPRALVFLSPFVAGWIIALIAGPLVRFFEEKVKLKRKIGSAFVIIAVIALVVLVLYIIFVQLFEQVKGLAGALPEMLEKAEADFNSIGNNLNALLAKLPGDIQLKLDDNAIKLDEYMGEFLSRFGSPTIEAAGNFAKQLPAVFIGLIMALLSSYFFVAERQQINEWFREHMPSSILLRYRMICDSLLKSVGGYLKAQLKIEVWMYFLLLIGLGILRVNYFAVIALVIAFLDFLPFLGTGTVLIPWAIIEFFNRQFYMGVALLVLYFVSQLVRQLIQPKIVGDSMGLPPLLTLILLYIGFRAGGVSGMILAVPLGLILIEIYKAGVFDMMIEGVRELIGEVRRFMGAGPEGP